MTRFIRPYKTILSFVSTERTDSVAYTHRQILNYRNGQMDFIVVVPTEPKNGQNDIRNKGFSFF